MPTKKKTRLAKFADGGGVRYPHGRMAADSDEPNTYLGNVRERIINLVAPARRATPAATVATPNPEDLVNPRLTRDLRSGFTQAEDADNYRKGGRVKAKSKPRGVGLARKGHGKAMK